MTGLTSTLKRSAQPQTGVYARRDEIARCEAIIRDRARTLLAGLPGPTGAAPQLAYEPR